MCGIATFTMLVSRISRIDASVTVIAMIQRCGYEGSSARVESNSAVADDMGYFVTTVALTLMTGRTGCAASTVPSTRRSCRSSPCRHDRHDRRVDAHARPQRMRGVERAVHADAD